MPTIAKKESICAFRRDKCEPKPVTRDAYLKDNLLGNKKQRQASLKHSRISSL